MPDIRLIAMDMDGTLLGKERGVIPPVNLQALRDAQARGIHLCLASGRALDDAGFHAFDAGLSMAVIALNGGVICLEPLGPVVSSRHIPEAAARRVYGLIQQAGLPFALFSDHDVALSRPSAYAGQLKEVWGTFMDREGGRTRVLTDPGAVEPRLARVSKFVVTSISDPALLPPLRESIGSLCPEVEVTSSWMDNIEINPRGVNKGSALTALAERLGIPMAQVMAIGDNDNDVSMLEAAGYGVAMGNATPAAMAAAAYVTLPCLEDGVAAAIRALALGERVPGVKPLR
ncbi:MAG: Cof-type HAD-IIB family hydrolase [Aristaeellaceae bacterium]